MGAGNSFLSLNTCGPLKPILLNNIGKAVVFALKSLKGADPAQFNEAIKRVMDKFCKSRGLFEPPFLMEIKEKIKEVITENFAEDLARMAEDAALEVEAKAIKHARDKKVDEMLAQYEANGNTVPGGGADLAILVSGKNKKGKGSSKDTDCPVMISYIFSEAFEEAKALAARLREKGIKVYLSDTANKDGEEVSQALVHAQVVVMLASKNYGQSEPQNAVDTAQEMMYATAKNKAYLVKVGNKVKPFGLESWAVPMTFIKLSHLLYREWEKNTVIPTSIVDEVVKVLEEKKTGA